MATEQGGAGGRPPESDKGGGGIISSVTNWFTRGNSQKGSEESQYKEEYQLHRPKPSPHSDDSDNLEQFQEALSARVAEVDILKGKITKLSQTISDRNQQIIALRQQNQTDASNYQAEISMLKQQLSEQTKKGPKFGKGSSNIKLEEHAKKQSEIIKDLRQKIECFEMASSDKDSYQELLAEIEDERDKLREDFVSAREEMDHLRRENEALKQELHFSKQEAFRFSMESQATGTQSSVFGCSNSECKEMCSKIGDLKIKLNEKTAELDTMKQTLERLQGELKEAAGDIAAAKVEAEIYKSDFMEERKDRERAQGALDDLQQKEKKEGVMQKQVTHLRAEVKTLKEERNTMKMEWARVKAKLEKDFESSKLVIGNLRDQVERVSEQRDDLKYEVERRKESKNKKIKEYDKMKVQLKKSSAFSVHLHGELEKARKDVKELQKFKKKAESKAKKVEKEKTNTKASNRSSAHPQSESEKNSLPVERLYQEERDRNESLEIENEQLREEVEYQKSLFKELLQKELTDAIPLSPEDDKKSLKSLTDDAASTDKDPFENDPNYVASEDPELPHLDKQFMNAKGTGSYLSQNPGEAGVGAHSQDLSNQKPQSGPARAHENVPQEIRDEGSSNLDHEAAQRKHRSAPQNTDQCHQQQQLTGVSTSSDQRKLQQQGQFRSTDQKLRPPMQGGGGLQGPVRVTHPQDKSLQQQQLSPVHNPPPGIDGWQGRASTGEVPHHHQRSGGNSHHANTHPVQSQQQFEQRQQLPPGGGPNIPASEGEGPNQRQATQGAGDQGLTRPPHEAQHQGQPRTGGIPQPAQPQYGPEPSYRPNTFPQWQQQQQQHGGLHPAHGAGGHPQVPSSVNRPPGQEYHEGTVRYQQSQQQFNQQYGQPNAMLGARAGGQAQPQQLPSPVGHPQGNDQQGHPRTEEAAQHLQHGPQRYHHTYLQAQQFQERQQQSQGLGRQNFPDNQAHAGQQYPQPYSPQVEGQGYPQQPQRAGGVPPRAGGMLPRAGGTNPNPVPRDKGTTMPPLQTTQGGGEHAMNQQGSRDLTYVNVFDGEHQTGVDHCHPRPDCSHNDMTTNRQSNVHSIDTQTSVNFEEKPHSANFSSQTSRPTSDAVSTQTSFEKNDPGNDPPKGEKRGKLEKEASTENILIENIDDEVKQMAQEVREEVGEDRKRLHTMQQKPFDPNLVCPMCTRKFRIGEIQKFRAHVDACEGTSD